MVAVSQIPKAETGARRIQDASATGVILADLRLARRSLSCVLVNSEAYDSEKASQSQGIREPKKFSDEEN
jgi:hypothetical protein